MMDPAVKPGVAPGDGATSSGVALLRVRQCSGVLFIAAEWRGTPFERALLDGVAGLEKRYTLYSVQSAASSRVYRFSIDCGGTDKAVYFKEYLSRSVWDAIKHIVRPSRAMRAYSASAMLTAHGFKAPRVIALKEWRTALWRKHCIVVTEAVAGAKPVHALLATDSADLQDLRSRRAFIRTLGRTIGRMHRAGIVHGDLRLGNVLARRTDDSWEFFFLDNERTRRWLWMPARLRLKNLVQANMPTAGITRTDRLRFFNAYLSACVALRPVRKRWAERIQARTLERRNEYLREGRTVRA
ncbi:MAG TPA: lipopolysaccharide kinase InaA family protein [Sedimentisphaerales bacterium]|jgi:tRNA A-37 threonylcarbamoyl transferase component Bud32|nr:lipopolysaccharide kinase InaA family protein [Sedimentisphaerales bacterium]HNU29613.1 lipopolysaccharide kinase InaA family protein [Sedimentisphaerales bacterium]